MTPTLFPQGEDAAPLAAIHGECFPDPWDSRAIAELLAMPGAFAIAAPDGFILVRVAADEAEILTLAVLPKSRRQGTGRALAISAAAHARSIGARAMFLEVAAGNLAARALYRRLGFVRSGRRRGYYTSGREVPEDALVLRSNLPLSPLGKSPPAG
ncbi:MAG TPA: GNAT family N-acetyltransferase [Rhizomicrobium sp.]|nr:GNAT family N-acetyltransferase [Rhizomicrobium sp.]